MFGSKLQEEELRLLRLQNDITRDRLRFQQRLELVEDQPLEEEAARTSASGRLYQVFVSMGKA
jgi:hypothetical protein